MFLLLYSLSFVQDKKIRYEKYQRAIKKEQRVFKWGCTVLDEGLPTHVRSCIHVQCVLNGTILERSYLNFCSLNFDLVRNGKTKVQFMLYCFTTCILRTNILQLQNCSINIFVNIIVYFLNTAYCNQLQWVCQLPQQILCHFHCIFFVATNEKSLCHFHCIIFTACSSLLPMNKFNVTAICYCLCMLLVASYQ